MRVLISTQGKPYSPVVIVCRGELMCIVLHAEPTVVPPVLLDLCTVTILHRFSSPSWWKHISFHISADVSDEAAFDKVVRLQVSMAGFAILL